MGDKTINNGDIQVKLAKGWRPNMYLTNMSVAWFQPDENFIAPDIFPIVPVRLTASNYYIWEKADLARDNVQRKPEFGKVQPAIMATSDDLYHCKVDQVIVGIDQISTQDYSRSGAPGMADPRTAKVRFVNNQLKLHLDRMWARGFMRKGVWGNEWQGVTGAAPGGKQFYKFKDANFDPIRFFNGLKRDMLERGLREPNTLTLGIDAYYDLTENPDVIERVKYSGSTLNPAVVNMQALAALLGFQRVKVCKSVYNSAGNGKEAMQFMVDPHTALISYATPNPAVDEQTAGYIFGWDMLGNGSPQYVDQWEGEKGTHSEFVEGLMSYDMKKVCDELGIFLYDC